MVAYGYIRLRLFAQAGISECLVQSAEACLPDLREALYSNIILTGGTALLPNFEARLRAELREIVPSEFEVRHDSV